MRPLSEHMFCSLGCRPVVNACGVYTDLGGSILSPRVWQAMQEANECFVSMPELLDQTGRMVARLMEAEAARITMSASAAITLATAACMAGSDGDKMDRLPDSEGMKNRVLIQKRHRYKYDRMVRSAGAHLVEVGDAGGTTAEQLAEAVDDMTAAICFPAHFNGDCRQRLALRVPAPSPMSRQCRSSLTRPTSTTPSLSCRASASKAPIS